MRPSAARPRATHRDEFAGTGVRPAASETLRPGRRPRTCASSTPSRRALNSAESSYAPLRDRIFGHRTHTGRPARVRVLPAPAGSGSAFSPRRRGRISGACPTTSSTRRRATVVGLGEHRVSTVEHLLSALCAAADHQRAHRRRRTRDSGRRRQRARLSRRDRSGRHQRAARAARYASSCANRTSSATATSCSRSLPAPAFRVRMTIDFPAPVGTQYVDFDSDRATLSRGGCAEPDVRFPPRGRSAARGAASRSAARSRTRSCSTPTARCRRCVRPTKPVRHKVLDLIGDFALLGAYPQCEVIAIKSGHALHYERYASWPRERRSTPRARARMPRGRRSTCARS